MQVRVDQRAVLAVERVLEEIGLVATRGSGRLWFADPNFSFDRKRVVAILEEGGLLDSGGAGQAAMEAALESEFVFPVK